MREPPSPAPAMAELLAARFDDEVVVLDVATARLAHLDAPSARVWTACTHRTRQEIAQAAGLTQRRTRSILRDLQAGGLVHCEADHWHRLAVEEV